MILDPQQSDRLIVFTRGILAGIFLIYGAARLRRDRWIGVGYWIMAAIFLYLGLKGVFK